MSTKTIILSCLCLLLVPITVLHSTPKESKKSTTTSTLDKKEPQAEATQQEKKEQQEEESPATEEEEDLSQRSLNGDEKKEEEEEEEEKKERVKEHTKEELAIEINPEEVYGSDTTQFITKREIKYNRGKYHNVSFPPLHQLHWITPIEKHFGEYQDLGLSGSSMRPLFYQLPTSLGSTPGFTSYDPFFASAHTLRYYDTKSPHTKLFIIPGRKRAMLTLGYTQNVNKNWNVGANFSQISVAFPLKGKEEEEDKNTKMRYSTPRTYDVFTSYKTDSGRYKVLANMSFMKHFARETNGFYIDPTKKSASKKRKKKKDLEKRLDYKNLKLKAKMPHFSPGAIENREPGADGKRGFSHLSSPERRLESRDIRKKLSIYQEYIHRNWLQGYHDFEWSPTKQSFGIKVYEDDHGDKAEYNPKLPIDQVVTHRFKNEVGFKGSLKGFFYRPYYRNQYTTYRLSHLKDSDPKRSHEIKENFVGLHARYSFNKKQSRLIAINTEVSLDKTSPYQLGAKYEDPFFEVSCQHIKSLPSLLMQLPYRSTLTNGTRWNELRGIFNGLNAYNHRPAMYWQKDKSYKYWNKNKLKSPQSTELYGCVKLNTSFISIQPHVTFTRIQHHLYFQEYKTKPFQEREKELRKKLKSKKSSSRQALHRMVAPLKPASTKGPLYILKPGIKLNLTLGKFHLDNSLTLFSRAYEPKKAPFFLQEEVQKNKKKRKLYSFPEHIIQTSIYITPSLKSGKIKMATGFDIRYMSRYWMYHYNPVLRQFYPKKFTNGVPEKGMIYEPHLSGDLFFNLRAYHCLFFLKFHNLVNRFMTSEKEHLATPHYPKPKNIYEFGFGWYLFD